MISYKTRMCSGTLSLIFAMGLPLHANAEVSSAEASKLGVTGTPLTPTGAQRAGNADGSIPEWTGGITVPPPGFVAGSGQYVDPFKDDKPLFSITAQNYEKYKDRLSEAQIAMLKKYPDSFKMDIYPTRRSFSAPDWWYQQSMKNATSVKLDTQGYDAANYFNGLCFPLPKSGIEARLNNIEWRCQYTTKGRTEWLNATIVDPSGSWQTAYLEEHAQLKFNDSNAKPFSFVPTYKLLQVTRGPARLAGNAILYIADLNYQRGGGAENIWSYNPGQRRIRRAPQVSYDNPKSGSNGQIAVHEQYCVAHGNQDRYDWSLKETKELYIPYNNYKALDRNLREKDFIKPGHMNQDLVRYELHRVHVIEGVQKSQYHMAYNRMVIYADEDSWRSSVVDIYDTDNKPWKLDECLTANYYDHRVMGRVVETKYDLNSTGYAVVGISTDQPSQAVQFDVDNDDSLYTLGNLQTVGGR